MQNIGEKIYNLRKEKGVSQEELANMLGVSRQTVSKWELNTVRPTAKNMDSICELFEVDLGYFFGIQNTQLAIANNYEGKTEVLENENTQKKSNFSTLKIVSMVIAIVLLVLFIIACGLAFYLTVLPDSETFDYTDHYINYVGIAVFISGILAMAVFITLVAIFIYKRITKRKNRHKKQNANQK